MIEVFSHSNYPYLIIATITRLLLDRALARWPSYFALAWSDLKQVVGSAAHETLSAEVHDRVVAVAGRILPNPGGLVGARLRGAADKDSAAELLQVSRLFQWLLPGLVTNVAFFRRQFAHP
jgi:hypothetical protein